MIKKIIKSFYDPILRRTFYSLNGIDADEEIVEIENIYRNEKGNTVEVTYIGYEEVPDQRSEDEIWRDSYYYNYVRPLTLKEVKIDISNSVKTVKLSSEIQYISDIALNEIKGVKFEIDSRNMFYYSKGGSIYKKETNKEIYKYNK